MRISDGTTARVLGATAGGPATAVDEPRPRSRERKPFRLDLAALAQARASKVLALAPEAFGELFVLAAAAPGPTATSPDQIACVDIMGPLSQRAEEWLCGFADGYDAICERFIDAITDPTVSAVVLRFDSPGGDVAGLEECVRRMSEARDQTGKPVYAYVDEFAASAAYWLAAGVASSGVYLPSSGSCGSIGCIAVHVDQSAALEMDGFKPTIIRDPAGKAAGHPYEPLSDLAKGRIESVVAEASGRFIDAIAAARNLSAEDVRGFDGAMFIGADAKKAGLADGVKTFEQVLQMAAKDGRAAAKSRGDKTMNKAMLLALGLAETATETEALAAIESLKSDRSSVVKLLGALRKTNVGEAIGAISALEANATALPAALARVKELEGIAESADAKALIDAAQRDNKVTPATRAKTEALYAAHGAGALKAHLEALVPVAPAAKTAAAEPETKGRPSDEATTASAQSGGRAYEQMSAADLHNLRASGEPGARAYDTLRADWIARGKPKAVKAA